MNEKQLILEVLSQTFEGKAWHGPSFLEVLDGVDRKQAMKQPLGERHSIWEIVDHCSYWMETVIVTLRDKRLPDFNSSEDWSQMGETVGDWEKTLERLMGVYQELIISIKEFDEPLFAKEIHGSFNGQTYAIKYRKILHGISDHNTYHAGQISLLKMKTT